MAAADTFRPTSLPTEIKISELIDVRSQVSLKIMPTDLIFVRDQLVAEAQVQTEAPHCLILKQSVRIAQPKQHGVNLEGLTHRYKSRLRSCHI